MAWATAHAFEPKDPMSRSTLQPEHPPKVTDLLIRQKCEAMIEYGYVARYVQQVGDRRVVQQPTGLVAI